MKLDSPVIGVEEKTVHLRKSAGSADLFRSMLSYSYLQAILYLRLGYPNSNIKGNAAFVKHFSAENDKSGFQEIV